MAKTNKRLQDIFERYLIGTASEAEKAELWDYINDPVFAGEIDELLGKDYTRSHNEFGLNEVQRTEILQNVFAYKPHQKLRTVRLWPRIVAAASITIAVMAGGYFYYNSQLNKDSADLIVANDVAPGKNGATLTLANGQKIYINDALAGNIANETGVKITKTKDGQIIYEVIENGNSALAYNTLTTTRGEQTQVRLPDGTSVFLNSESSLKYPTSFAKSDKRIVSLEGEGFFDVSKDKAHPFIVETGNQQVEVLGTQFNISSYKDEHSVKTTLIEGSVKLTGAGNISKILKPNQQAIVSDKGIAVENVEAQFSIDWKEGFFMFDNETLESIMKRVSRWYNIKVVYEDEELKKVTAIGTVNKFDHISAVIQVLEKGKLAKFRLDNNILTIGKRN